MTYDQSGPSILVGTVTVSRSSVAPESSFELVVVVECDVGEAFGSHPRTIKRRDPISTKQREDRNESLITFIKAASLFWDKFDGLPVTGFQSNPNKAVISVPSANVNEQSR